MEEYKFNILKNNYNKIKIELTKEFPVYVTSGSGKPTKIKLADFVLAEDLPVFAGKIQELTTDNKSELYAHFRIDFDGDIRRFLICARLFKAAVRHYVEGVIIDVSKYIDKAINDPSFDGSVIKPGDTDDIKLYDLVSREYLEKLQTPFKLCDGVVSAMFDEQNKLICTSNPENPKAFDITSFPFIKKEEVRINRELIAEWLIGAHKGEIIAKYVPLLEVMAEALTRILKSLMLLYKELTNSEQTSKMLSENIEQQMLINSIYNEIFANKSTGEIINAVLKTFGEYLKIDTICLYTEEPTKEEFNQLFVWAAHERGKGVNPLIIRYDDIPLIREQLDFTDFYFPTNGSHELNRFGIKNFVAVALKGEGERCGMALYGLTHEGRLPTSLEVKIVRNISHILSSLLLKHHADLLVEETNSKVSYLAYHDPVLDIPNRSKLDIDLKKEFDEQKAGAVVYLKITNLRIFNELFGHSYTDMLIKGVIDYIKTIPNKKCEIYRFSGNIITILMPGADAFEAREFAEVLLIRFKRPWHREGNEHCLDAGLGVTLYPQNGKSNEEIYRASSLSMYRAIEYGANSYVFYSKEFEKPAAADYFYTEKLRNDMNDKMRGFYLKYQPVINPKTGDLGPFEAFINWNSADGDTLEPQNIVRLAEAIGFDIRLDKWVLAKACSFCKQMQRNFEPEFSVSVNITARELLSGTIVSMVKDALRKSGLKGEYLNIEITERVLANTKNNIVPIIAKLKELGVKIIVDSFGRDFIATSLLKYSYVDMLKADFALFTNVFEDYDRILRDSVVKLANTVSDGLCVKRVENGEQLKLLEDYDINWLQGYLITKPVTEVELVGFFTEYETAKEWLFAAERTR
ncbi:MAG: GGDEF domain-containing protein [Oscillospiraceae bacterium]|nr:GGDEF domain-containing protein [Oscillospiraceae bacterium]